LVIPDADDVAERVNYASRMGLRVAVQGTGHGAATLGPLDDTVLIKTHELEEVTVDSANRRARVGAGVIWEDVSSRRPRSASGSLSHPRDGQPGRVSRHRPRP